MTPIVVPDDTKSISCAMTVGDLTLTRWMDAEPADLITYYKEDSYFVFVIRDSDGAVKNKSYMLCEDNTPNIVLDYASSQSAYTDKSGNYRLLSIASYAIPSNATVITTIPDGVNTVFLWVYPKSSCLRCYRTRVVVSSGSVITAVFTTTKTIFYSDGVVLNTVNVESVAAEVSYDAALIK